MRRKSLIRRLIPWILLAGALAALVIFVGIPLYGQQEVVVENPPRISYYEGDEGEITMENERLLFTMDRATTRFEVTDKVSGQVWRSNPEDAAKDPVALSLNKDTLLSTLLGVVAFSSFWSILELFQQRERVRKGWFPANPKQKTRK